MELEEFYLEKDNFSEQIILALNSSEYVKLVKLGEVLYRQSDTRIKRSESSSKNQLDQDYFNFVDFTAHCYLISNSTSDDVKSKITESCAQFLNKTMSFEIEGVIFVSNRQTLEIEKHVNITEIFKPPNSTEFDRIMKDDNKTYCKNLNQWTSWYSFDNARNGSDIELLAQHVNPSQTNVILGV